MVGLLSSSQIVSGNLEEEIGSTSSKSHSPLPLKTLASCMYTYYGPGSCAFLAKWVNFIKDNLEL